MAYSPSKGTELANTLGKGGSSGAEGAGISPVEGLGGAAGNEAAELTEGPAPDGTDPLWSLSRPGGGQANGTSGASSMGDSWEQLSIGRGQSFYVALSRAGLSHESIMGLVKACKSHINLRRVQRGDSFDLKRNANNEVESFLVELDAEHYLLVNRNEDGYSSEMGSYELQRTVKGVRGEIRSSLFDALVAQGADPTLAVQLSEILGWDIDFFRDLRRGDTFTLLYEEYTREGERVRDGRILSAEFTNRGRTYQAYLFEDELGFPAYYEFNGNSLEKQFLRAPIKYSRISSGFTRRRLHPVTKTYRPHNGVDYVAPTGTPIYATADGTVTVRQRKRANGNHVQLRHGNGYETWYLHMSRYAKGLTVGKKVQQGDIIGYVGQTGYATGPHVCYRVKLNGRWLNPSKLDLPPAEPVDEARMADYVAVRDEQRSRLDEVPGMEAKTVVLESQITHGSNGPAGR